MATEKHVIAHHVITDSDPMKAEIREVLRQISSQFEWPRGTALAETQEDIWDATVGAARKAIDKVLSWDYELDLMVRGLQEVVDIAPNGFPNAGEWASYINNILSNQDYPDPVRLDPFLRDYGSYDKRGLPNLAGLASYIANETLVGIKRYEEKTQEYKEDGEGWYDASFGSQRAYLDAAAAMEERGIAEVEHNKATMIAEYYGTLENIRTIGTSQLDSVEWGESVSQMRDVLKRNEKALRTSGNDEEVKVMRLALGVIIANYAEFERAHKKGSHVNGLNSYDVSYGVLGYKRGIEAAKSALFNCFDGGKNIDALAKIVLGDRTASSWRGNIQSGALMTGIANAAIEGATSIRVSKDNRIADLYLQGDLSLALWHLKNEGVSLPLFEDATQKYEIKFELLRRLNENPAYDVKELTNKIAEQLTTGFIERTWLTKDLYPTNQNELAIRVEAAIKELANGHVVSLKDGIVSLPHDHLLTISTEEPHSLIVEMQSVIGPWLDNMWQKYEDLKKASYEACRCSPDVDPGGDLNRAVEANGWLILEGSNGATYLIKDGNDKEVWVSQEPFDKVLRSSMVDHVKLPGIELEPAADFYIQSDVNGEERTWVIWGERMRDTIGTKVEGTSRENTSDKGKGKHQGPLFSIDY